MQKIILILICVFTISACRAETVTDFLSEDRASESSALVEAISNTPYSALVRIISVDVINLFDEDKSDDFSEQKFIYHLEVLKTFRGQENTEISYYSIVEKGEIPNSGTETFIITLCESKEGYFWPGVGAIYSADNNLIEISVWAGKNVNKNQVDFSEC